MSSDDQLQQTLDTAIKRLHDEVAVCLRDEVARQVRIASDELTAVAQAERAAAERAAAERAEQVAAERVERAVAEHAERAAAERVVAERVVAERTAAERALAERAAAEGAAADRAAAERAAADRATAERSKQAAAERGSAIRLVAAIRALGGAGSLSEILDTLVQCAGQEAARAGVLLVRGDRFHGFRFAGFGPALKIDDHLDIGHRDAGVVAHALRSAAMASSVSDAGDGAPAFAQLKPGQACVAIPLVIGGQVVAVMYADAGSEPGTVNPEPGTVNREPGTLNLEPLEILTRFASQRLEAVTAIKAARSLTANPEPPSPAPERSDGSADQHAAARRYARLLVSEIRLYHEPQVAEGRRERDLTTRLGGEIARVRTLYEQRVPAAVRQGTDYVHEELIRTLADGDASLLEAKTY